MNRASRALVFLLCLTVALAGLFAYEAWCATRSHRITADRALRDYATVAARELATASDEALEVLLAPVLDPVVGSPAASPYETLPPPSILAGSAAGVLQCGSTDPGRGYFAIDFRNGALTVAGAKPDAATAAWLRGAVRPTAARSAIAWGKGAAAGRVALYGVKRLRYSGFGAHDAPLAAYGLITCRDALRPVIAGVFDQHPLLPRSVSGGIPNADLVGVEVSAPDGAPLFRVGSGEDAGFVGDTASVAAGAPLFRATLPASAAGRLAVTHPGSRLPLLFGLLVVTAGLAAIALRQLRREQELAWLRADFTSSVSHELRTPLTQILLFAETLEQGRAGGEGDRRQALGIIVQEARRLAHLVENVLQFSGAERRTVRVPIVDRRLAPLLRDTVRLFAPLAAAGVRIEVELDEALVAPVHPDSLRQIVINLLDNAAKYGGGSEPITLRATLADERARLEMEDAGRGIAEQDRERIWQPFVRLAGASAVTGSGIGLAVVRDLVVGHGGRCWAEAAPRGGARFVVELPGGRRDASAEAA